MPVVIEVIIIVLGVLDAGWVSTSYEMRDASFFAGRCVPQDLIGAGVEHGRRPDREDSVLRNESAIVEQGLVLAHTVVERDVVVFQPAAERV